MIPPIYSCINLPMYSCKTYCLLKKINEIKSNKKRIFYNFIHLFYLLTYLGTDHLTWRGGGVMVFCFVQNFFSDNTRVRIFFFCHTKCKFFFKNLTLGYMTKTLNHIFFFFHQNQNIFFSNIGNQNIFLVSASELMVHEKFVWNFLMSCTILLAIA